MKPHRDRGVILMGVYLWTFITASVVTVLLIVYWDSFPAWLQATLKVVGAVLGVLVVGIGLWSAWKNRGKHPGF